MTDWTEKYRPSSLAEIRGNNTARDELREWADTWDEHGRAVILHGSPGVGKTSAAHALASDRNWPMIELNASDHRQADVIERVAGEAARSGTLTGGGAGRRLVILDEADNFHGSVDYGGAAEVTKLVKDAGQPTVLIANEFYEMSQALRRACEDIEFRDLRTSSIVPALRDICRREGIDFEEAALEAIAKTAGGDLRSAVNDLQAVAEVTETLTVEDVVTGERDRETGIFEFLDALLKEEDPEGALRAGYDVDETPDDLLRWIEDNVPKDYAGGELADAYESMTLADKWLGRTLATQNYTLWRYASDNMTAGVAAARREPKGGWTRYGPPSYWSKLGRTRSTRDTRDAIARRVGATEGTSLATARREILTYLTAMTHHCKPRELTVGTAAAYDLDAGEVSFVTGSGADTNKVQSIVDDARARTQEGVLEHADGAFAVRTPSESGDDGGDIDDDGTRGDDGDDGNDDGEAIDDGASDHGGLGEWTDVGAEPETVDSVGSSDDGDAVGEGESLTAPPGESTDTDSLRDESVEAAGDGDGHEESVEADGNDASVVDDGDEESSDADSIADEENDQSGLEDFF